MRFTDTHCHLHDPDTYAFAIRRRLENSKKFRRLDAETQSEQLAAAREHFSVAAQLERAAAAGVQRVICVGTTSADSLRAATVAADAASAAAHAAANTAAGAAAPTLGRAAVAEVAADAAVPTQVFWSYGVHPDGATEPQPDHLEQIQDLPVAARERLVAIGEVGLDYHEPHCDRAAQIRLFESMLDLAQRLHLPLIFHVREAFADFFAVLGNFSSHPVRGVVHSFSDSPENLARALDAGFYIGVNGLATFTDLPLPPLERLLLETDAPFLAPAGHRGEVNESALIPTIAARLADRLQMPLDHLATVAEQNATQLFGL